MKVHTICTAALAVLVSGVAANAQYDSTPIYSSGPNSFQSHASTAQEGILRGQAQLIASAGRYNHDTSLAEINHEDAMTKYYENEKLKVNAYFERRKQNRDARRAERGPRPTSQEIARYARLRAPKGLNKSQYEPELKQVYWPDVLRTDVFASERNMIDRLVAERSFQDGGIGSIEHRMIKQLSNKMKAKLKTQIDFLSPAEYVLAKQYITGIEVEFQSTVLSSSVAEN